MMKLGLVSAILPGLTFEELVDYAASVGLECLEVCCWPKGKAARRYAGVTHIDLAEADSRKLRYYREYAKERGIAISSLGYYPNPLDSDLEAREVAHEQLRRMIDASHEMEIGLVTTFIGRDRSRTVEDNLNLYEELWAPLIRRAEEMDVRIAIENCPMLYTANEWPGGHNLGSAPYLWRQLFERIPSSHLGLNYDPSHPYLQQADYLRPVYEFKDKLFHIHIKDIKIYPDKLYEYGVFSYPSLWHAPKLPGLGGVDFSAFISALNDVGYRGPACIEVEDRAFEDSLENVKRGIRQSVRFLRQYM